MFLVEYEWVSRPIKLDALHKHNILYVNHICFCIIMLVFTVLFYSSFYVFFLCIYLGCGQFFISEENY